MPSNLALPYVRKQGHSGCVTQWGVPLSPKPEPMQAQGSEILLHTETMWVTPVMWGRDLTLGR